MKKMRFQWAALAVSAAVLSACGGGGDDAATTVAAEGFWTATTSDGLEVSLAILENGETWGVYADSSVAGVLYGNASTSGSSVSGTGKTFDIVDRTVSSGTFSGTFAPKSSLSVTTSDGTRINASYEADYDQPALLSNIAGSYSGIGLSGFSNVQSIPITIAEDGSVSTPVDPQCTATGAVTPRPSGKNVFNVTVTFNGTNCALGDGTTTTGVAYYDTVDRVLLVLALNAAKTDGFIYEGTKSNVAR